ncbi:DUF2061 domain-containing protein [Echinicola jeungdonensis]|uniref:DUF2061 domain-containing protein n=1 Tax=Echinicola jeungdonensis TaxID=709343 RepID=A0ABV5J394_9BACT|nr:DUF2061 domain-containing protein [Echinicola jeungdonensis]MDN3668897.1 DUF2061 domain-containing protein [Echinicola jeungdonensis]
MIFDQPLRRIFADNEGRDSNAKSVIKSISWRLVGTIDTMVISYWVTGQVDMALSIGSIEVVSKMVLYYLHERVWEKAAQN